jgi:hypothetical protein
MTNVPNVQGPLNQPNPQDKPSVVNEHKFKETLHQRVEKTDADQKKQRRQQEEDSEVEQQPSSEQAPTSVPEGQDSFLSVQQGRAQSFQSSPSTATPQSSSSLYTSTPSIEETQETPSSTASSSQRSSSTQQVSAAPQKDHKHQESSHVSSSTAQPIIPLAAPPLPLPPPAKEIPDLPFPLLEELPLTAPLAELVQPPLLLETDKKKEALSLEALPEDTTLLSIQTPILLAPQALGSEDPFSRLPPAIQEIVSKMLGVMTIWKQTPGVTETSFTLNNPKFASSVFFGTQIIIKEYSTAPLAFNVQLNTSPQATALLQSNLGDLMAALQAGRYNFKVNRLDTGLLVERPLFHRKEEANQQDTGEQK